MSERETVGWVVRNKGYPEHGYASDGPLMACPWDDRSKAIRFASRDAADAWIEKRLELNTGWTRDKYAVLRLTRRAKPPEPQPRMVAVEDVLRVIDDLASSTEESVKASAAEQWWDDAFSLASRIEAYDIVRNEIRALAERKP